MLARKLLIATVAFAATACGPNGNDQATQALPALSPTNELNSVADEYLRVTIEASPFSVVFAGLGGTVDVDNASFNDNSPEGRAALEASEDALLARLNLLAPGAFTKGQDWVLHESLVEALEADIEARVCQSQWWSLNHMFGWQNGFARVAAAQPIETDEDRAAALARWSQLPGYIAQERANLEEGLANGYSVPKRIAARVVAQLDSLLEIEPENSPFVSFLAHVDDADYEAAALRLVFEKINPAILMFRNYLRDAYIPAARDDLSISALPNGAACYEARLRGYHTAEIGSEATYKLGRETVETYKMDVIDRGEAMFGLKELELILDRVAKTPDNRFDSETQLIEETRALIGITRAKIEPFFSKFPEQEVVVEPYPDYLKGTGQSSRYEQKPAGDGPAIYRINTDDWRDDTRGGAQIVAVHEGWPGHHLQIATSNSLKVHHPVLNLLRSTAYVEGWARYAEALAEEAGVYESGYGEITRRAWPARGMVVDPGMHVFGWTNDEAKAFLKESGRFSDEASLEARLDRIAVIPGQLTAYDTGGLEIFALRREAEDRLGERFDVKEFHDRILENGAVPLGALRAHVKAWIEAEEAKYE